MVLVISLIVAGGVLNLTPGYAAQPARHAAATPTWDNAMWKKLSALRSYHAESTLSWTSSTAKSGSARWSEDVHGKDFHLILSASSSGAQKGEMYFVGGHFYIGQAGHFMDLGDLGKQMADAMLAMTLGYWTALAGGERNVHYVGRVTTSGRAADRYTVQYQAIVPAGTGGQFTSNASAYFSNTVDVDVATHAPLRVTGTYRGKDGQGHTATLTTMFVVTRIGQIGAIKLP